MPKRGGQQGKCPLPGQLENSRLRPKLSEREFEEKVKERIARSGRRPDEMVRLVSSDARYEREA